MALTVSNYMIQPFFGEDDLPKSASTLLAAVFICGLTWLNCYSMKVTTRLQNVFMVTKVVALLLVILVGIYALSQGRSIYTLTLKKQVFLNSLLYFRVHVFVILQKSLKMPIFFINFQYNLCTRKKDQSISRFGLESQMRFQKSFGLIVYH